MPNRRPMKCEERPGKGARHGGKRDNWQGKDSTPVHLGTEANARRGRKSAPRDIRRLYLLLAMVSA